MEEEEKLINFRRKYQKGTLLNVPNKGFSNFGKKKSTNLNTTSQRAKPSIDLEKAKQMLESAKGKVAPTARHSVKQLQQFSLEKLIKLILLLQDEND